MARLDLTQHQKSIALVLKLISTTIYMRTGARPEQWLHEHILSRLALLLATGSAESRAWGVLIAEDRQRLLRDGKWVPVDEWFRGLDLTRYGRLTGRQERI